MVQTIEHRKGIYDDQGNRSDGGQLLDFVYAIGLLLEAMDLEHQKVLDVLFLACKDLSEPIRRQPLGIYVSHLLPPGGNVASDLQADVGFARSCLTVEQRNASLLDSTAQEAVELRASKGYPFHIRSREQCDKSILTPVV